VVPAKSLGRCSQDAILASKNAGLGVYQKAGFKLLDQVVGDDREWGGTGKFTWSMLERKAKK